MKSKIVVVIGIVALSLGLLWAVPALADKASVAIQAPSGAAQGAEITILLTVTHSANSERHFVEWVKVWVNNQEVNKWDFSSSKLPEANPFTREIKVSAGANLEIKAEASCNVHGGKGPAAVKIILK